MYNNYSYRLYLRKFQLRAQEKDTGMNNIIFECSEKDGSSAYLVT